MNSKPNSVSSTLISKGDLRKTRLRKSLQVVSILIETGNEDFWPIFEKLEGELLKIEQRQSKLSKYTAQ